MPAPSPVTKEDVEALRADIQNLQGTAGWLRHGFYGNRWRIRLIVLSLVMDLILTALIVIGAHGANSACHSANEARRAQRQLWAYVLSISPPKTPQEQQARQQFRVYVDHVFAPRRCDFWSDL